MNIQCFDDAPIPVQLSSNHTLAAKHFIGYYYTLGIHWGCMLQGKYGGNVYSATCTCLVIGYPYY